MLGYILGGWCLPFEWLSFVCDLRFPALSGLAPRKDSGFCAPLNPKPSMALFIAGQWQSLQAVLVRPDPATGSEVEYTLGAVTQEPH